MVSPAEQRERSQYLVDCYKISERRACRVLSLCLSSRRYKSQRLSDALLQKRVQVLAEERPRFGYRRLHIMLKREGFAVNHKRLYRNYCILGLQVPKRRRKRITRSIQRQKVLPSRPNERWSMDFTSDQLSDGRRFRTLNIVDDYTRESLAIAVHPSIPGFAVVGILNEVIKNRQCPQSIVTDNGPEFTSRALDVWAYQRGVKINFIQPGKPTQNAFIESFNGKFRDECLSANWFTSIFDARLEIERWRKDYNNNRPHSSLRGMTPREFRDACEGKDRTFNNY